MHLWQGASVAFFIYVMLVVLWRGSWGRGTGRTLAGSGLGLLVGLSSFAANDQPILQDWLLPPLVLFIAYWTSGLLFVAPVPRQERALMWLDDRMAIRALAHRMPRWMAELLELAYVAVYPLIPFALILHLTFSPDPDPSRFWSVILITDYFCFSILPWVQTRPPRAVEQAEPWASSVRRFNLRLLGATSIQVNTFPSGHAAEALAAALLVLDAPGPIVGLMFVAALAVSAGAVLGRYHYAADALTGWAVAIVVYSIV